MKQGAGVDLGYVKTGQDYGKALSGIGSLMAGHQKGQQINEGKKQLNAAWKAQDMQDLQRVAVEFPETAPQIKQMSDMSRFMRKDNQVSMYQGAQEAIDHSTSEDGTFDKQKLIGYLEKRFHKGATTKDGDMQNTKELLSRAMDEDSTSEELLGNLNKTISLAEKLVPELVNGGGKAGKYATRSQLFNDGSSIVGNPNTGRTEVRDRLGNLVEGEARLMTLEKGRESGISYEHDKSYANMMGAQTAKGKTEPEIQRQIQRAKSSQISADKNVPIMGKLRQNIKNYDLALKAVTDGANTGWVDRHMSSFNTASIELDQIRNELGLDIVGAGKFGALSESELKFALATAMPDSLEPEYLRKWINRKKTAQSLLLSEMQEATNLLTQGFSPAEVYGKMHALPAGRNEAQVRENMRKYDMSYEDVVKIMWENREIGKGAP